MSKRASRSAAPDNDELTLQIPTDGSVASLCATLESAALPRHPAAREGAHGEIGIEDHSEE